MAHSILAIDFGADTIAAAVVVAAPTPEPTVLHVSGEPTIGSHVLVDDSGGLLPANADAQNMIKVTGLAALLAKPPRIICSAPRSATTLVSVAVSPITEAAEAHFGGRIDMLVATHPLGWSQPVLDDFVVALSKHADEVKVVPWPNAIAARTAARADGGRWVTSLDFGAKSASITLVDSGRRRKMPVVAYSFTDPNGGARALDKQLVSAVLRSTGSDSTVLDASWWAAAAVEARRVRLEASRSSSVVAQFPAPVGAVSLASRDIRDVATFHMERVVQRLVNREEVSQLWALDKKRSKTLPAVEVSGGLSGETAVLEAIRSVVGPLDVAQEPTHAAACGAAILASHHVLREQRPKRRFRR
jgi:molecular chaperone DnaK (HSP70)